MPSSNNYRWLSVRVAKHCKTAGRANGFLLIIVCVCGSLFLSRARSAVCDSKIAHIRGEYDDGRKLIHVYVGPPKISTSKVAWKSHSQAHQGTVVRAMIPGKGYFIDLAANDFKFLSNSYSLETFEHWEGVCIEANRQYWEGHLSRR